MYIAKETKERFVKMLEDRQIIVIQCNKGASRKTYDFKIIGANDGGKWDFTPMVANVTNLPNNNGVQYLCIRSNDALDVIAETIESLNEEGVSHVEKSGYDLYNYVRDHICIFYL